MSKSLEQQIAEFHQWREEIAGAIDDYREWCAATGNADALQELHLYDQAEAVRKDQLVLAFVAEFARGKTETINALFFSDFKQRLLPCEAGRTTMCPTEIYWNPDEEPCIKLLPIETRKRDEGLSMLKRNPDEWSRLRLDTSSADALKQAFHVLVEQKLVSITEASELGLWDPDDADMVYSMQEGNRVMIPLWRHALINFPHPLLKSGLVILDTPGLNALGTEPDLTLNIIPSAHAVIFLLGADTGVTKSDMRVWNDYIRDRVSKKLAVLNKIDVLWDDLRSEAEVSAMIHSQLESSARQLGLNSSEVFAISAQKALLARVNNDETLLKRSGIEALEEVLAEQLVATKHNILRKTVVSSVGNMIKASRKMTQLRLVGMREQLDELNSLRGKNRDVVMELITQSSEDRKRYEETVRTFTLGNQKILAMGDVLMEHLSLESLDRMLDRSHHEIGDRWTTRGLNQGMKSLIRQTNAMAQSITEQGRQIKLMADDFYHLFYGKHGFDSRKPPLLDMSRFEQKMLELEKITDDFCADPINVMTEKHFLLRKFFFTLVGLVRNQFEQAQHQCRSWLKTLLAPLMLQIAEHKSKLDKRTESLMKIHRNLESLQKTINELQAQYYMLRDQGAALDLILLKLLKAQKNSDNNTPQPSAAAPSVSPEVPALV